MLLLKERRLSLADNKFNADYGQSCWIYWILSEQWNGDYFVMSHGYNNYDYADDDDRIIILYILARWQNNWTQRKKNSYLYVSHDPPFMTKEIIGILQNGKCYISIVHINTIMSRWS